MSWLRRLIGAMPADEIEGISLTSPGWALPSVADDASRFLRAIPRLVFSNAFVFLEGGSHPVRLRRLLQQRTVQVSPRPALGTLWPRQACFVVPAEPAILEEVATFAEGLPYPEVCDHLHVFSGEQVLLSGYDAFAQPFTLSAAVSEDAVRAFSAAVGCTYRREVREGAG